MLGTTFNFFQCFSEKKSFSLGQIDLKDLEILPYRFQKVRFSI